MSNFITGIIGLAAVMLFLGYYAWQVKDPAFAIIVIVILAMVITDFVQSLRSQRRR